MQSLPLLLALVLAMCLSVHMVSGQSLSSSDPGSNNRQLTSTANMIEQAFPNNQGQSITDDIQNKIITTLTPLRGSVSTVSQGLLTRAATAYKAQNPSFQMDFLFSSTNAGVKAAYINQGGFDFAVSTASPSAADMGAKPGIVYYSLHANGIVPVYSLPATITSGATLSLSGAILCRIYRANITQWNDPAIVKANPSMTWGAAAAQPITIILTNSVSATNLAFTTYCRKVDSGFKMAASSNPPYPTSQYGGFKSFANLDLVTSVVADTPFSLAISVLFNAKAIEVSVANMINSQGQILICNTNSMALNLFELSTNGYAAGTNSYDLTGPSTPQAWPILTMSYLYLDQQVTLTTCASKKLMLEFFLWFYTSSVVASIADSLNLVIFPSLLVDQLHILERLRAEVLCSDTMLVASNSHQGFVGINSLASSLVDLYASFYLAVDGTRSYQINSASESLMVQRVIAGELEVALVNMQQMQDTDVKLMNDGGAVPIPAFMSGIAPIFNLPLAITSMYANPAAVKQAGLPALYPLVLTLDVMTSLFLGQIDSWLDPLLTNLNPQLAPWFTATSADPTLTLVIGASRAGDPLKGALMLFNTMQTSSVAQKPENAVFFPAGGWISLDGTIITNPFLAVQASPITVANVTMIDVESRLTLKTSMTPGSVSYHLLGSSSTSTGQASTDPTVELQMQITNSAGAVEIVPPTAAALMNCAIKYTTVTGSNIGISDPLPASEVELIDAQINQMLDVNVQRHWVNPISPQPGCWPVSNLLSFVVPMYFTTSISVTSAGHGVSTSTAVANTCEEGTHALEFIHFIQSTPLLSSAANSFGLTRLAESSLVRKMTEQVLYSAKCDDTALLIIQPFYYTIPTAVSSFGKAVSIIGIFMAIVSAAILVTFRSEVVIRSASAPFLLFILSGVALLFGAITAWSADPSPQSCAAFSWLVNLGFMMLFVPLFLKTWRVWRIFSGAQLKVIKLSNNKLMVIMGVAVLIDFILMSAWQGVSPMTPIQYSKQIGSNYHYYTHCSVNPKGMPFVYLEGIYKCGLLLFGSVMAFSTRNVKGTFNEATQIAWSIYNTLATGLITVVIIVFIAAVETTLIVLVQIFILWLACCTWALLFIPKFHLLFQSEEAVIEASRSDLPQEKSGGFSFASVAVMSALQLKQYYNALKIQVSKVEKRLGFKVTTFLDAVEVPKSKNVVGGRGSHYSSHGNNSSIGNTSNETETSDGGVLAPDPDVARERALLFTSNQRSLLARTKVSAGPPSPSRVQVGSSTLPQRSHSTSFVRPQTPLLKQASGLRVTNVPPPAVTTVLPNAVVDLILNDNSVAAEGTESASKPPTHNAVTIHAAAAQTPVQDIGLTAITEASASSVISPPAEASPSPQESPVTPITTPTLNSGPPVIKASLATKPSSRASHTVMMNAIEEQ